MLTHIKSGARSARSSPLEAAIGLDRFALTGGLIRWARVNCHRPMGNQARKGMQYFAATYPPALPKHPLCANSRCRAGRPLAAGRFPVLHPTRRALVVRSAPAGSPDPLSGTGQQSVHGADAPDRRAPPAGLPAGRRHQVQPNNPGQGHAARSSKAGRRRAREVAA